MHPDRFQRSRRAAGSRHAAVRTCARPARHAGAGKRGAEELALIVAAEIREIGGRPGEVKRFSLSPRRSNSTGCGNFFRTTFGPEIRVAFDSATRRVQAHDRSALPGSGGGCQARGTACGCRGAAAGGQRSPPDGCQLPNWDHGVEQWILRLNLLAQWCPDLQLPPITRSRTGNTSSSSFVSARFYKDIKDRDVRPVVKSWLSAGQRELLDKHAPERVTLPNGRTPKVTYESSGPPYISLRIQELFDVTQTPRIAMGRVPLSVHILAPSMRPVQVTQDLANFWREHYPRIKSELKRKYPKHEWR